MTETIRWTHRHHQENDDKLVDARDLSLLSKTEAWRKNRWTSKKSERFFKRWQMPLWNWPTRPDHWPLHSSGKPALTHYLQPSSSIICMIFKSICAESLSIFGDSFFLLSLPSTPKLHLSTCMAVRLNCSHPEENEQFFSCKKWLLMDDRHDADGEFSLNSKCRQKETRKKRHLTFWGAKRRVNRWWMHRWASAVKMASLSHPSSSPS